MQTFLKAYKQLEDALRNLDRPLSVLQYEETLAPEEMEKLRICRQIRNYVQHHNNAGFLTATPAMTHFVETLTQKELAKTEQAKDRLYRLSPITPDNTLQEVLQKFAATKRQWLPVVDEEGLFLGALPLTGFIIIYADTKPAGKKVKSLLKEQSFLKKLKNGKTIAKEEPLEGKEGQDLVITGANGNYCGIVKW